MTPPPTPAKTAKIPINVHPISKRIKKTKGLIPKGSIDPAAWSVPTLTATARRQQRIKAVIFNGFFLLAKNCLM
jgi:hypothetical protein